MTNGVTRRGFLAAAPAAVSAQTRGEPLRVAIVGTGNRGTFDMQALLKVPGVRVVAVCDLIEERARNAAALVSAAGNGDARVYANYRAMLDELKEIDAVVVATPDWTHKDVDIAVLEMGKHLYAEKPLALTPEDCRAVVREAKRTGKTFQVGFQLRHDPATSAAMKWIHGGGIGRVLMCHGIRHSGEGLPRNTPWYHDRTKSGDMLTDQGIHILDLFRWAIGGHPLRAYGVGGINLFKNEPPGRTSMDGYSVIYEYPNGVFINFSHHYYDPPRFTGTGEKVFGSDGSVDLVKGTWQAREKREMTQLEIADAGQDSTFLAMAHFVDCVRNGKQPLNSGDSALESTLQALMGTRAIYEKRIVTWEEVAG